MVLGKLSMPGRPATLDLSRARAYCACNSCGWGLFGIFLSSVGGGAMMLGKLPVPGRPTIWISVEQGPTALAVGAGGVVWTFLLSSILSLLFLPLFGRRSDID